MPYQTLLHTTTPYKASQNNDNIVIFSRPRPFIFNIQRAFHTWEDWYLYLGSSPVTSYMPNASRKLTKPSKASRVKYRSRLIFSYCNFLQKIWALNPSSQKEKTLYTPADSPLFSLKRGIVTKKRNFRPRAAGHSRKGGTARIQPRSQALSWERRCSQSS